MHRKVKIYIACAIRDVPENDKDNFLRYVKRSRERLRKLGMEVLDYVSPDRVEKVNIYRHDMEQVEEADMLVVISDYGSFGAGMELMHAIANTVPILVVSKNRTHKMISDAAKIHRFISCRTNVSNAAALQRAVEEVLQTQGVSLK